MKHKPYRRKVWGGFVDHRLHYRMVDTGFGGWGGRATMTLAIFTSRRDAKREYQDVRPIEVSELVNAQRVAKRNPG
jgi:hypothetical protein